MEREDRFSRAPREHAETIHVRTLIPRRVSLLCIPNLNLSLSFNLSAGQAIFDMGTQLVVGKLGQYGLIHRIPSEFFVLGTEPGGSRCIQIIAQCVVVNLFEFDSLRTEHASILPV
jgi:hypothetical protein